MGKIKISLCQMKVVDNRQENLLKAESMIEQATREKAQIVMLPEMFNCPYDINVFHKYAEKVPTGETTVFLSLLAKKYQIYLIGGSIPELAENNEIYNTSLIFNPNGELIGKHRKIHLFDVNVKGGICFTESAVLSSGNQITTVTTPWAKLGIIICYDIRFPELIRKTVNEGAEILLVPAAFNMTTGPAHWEILFRSRAIDNQIFILGNSPARNQEAKYIAYGHSLAVNPWGKILGELDDQEQLLTVELNMDEITEVRESLPIAKQRKEGNY